MHIALLVSLLLHAALLVQWWHTPAPDKPPAKWGDTPGQFNVQLVLPPAPKPAPAESSPPPTSLPAPPPAPQPAPRPWPETRSQSRSQASAPASTPVPASPPVLAMNQPRPESLPAPPPSTPSAQSAPSAPQPDMNAMIEERRRAREAANAPPALNPADDDTARRNKVVAANLSITQQAVGADPRQGGGVFTVQYVYQDDAAFIFYGWRAETGRKAAQTIELRRGSNPTMQIAVVRRMIVIIREHEKGDFAWQSPSARRTVILSAALRDTVMLENYLMNEFFGEGGVR